MKALTAKDPGNPDWLNSRAMIDSNIGALLIDRGRHDDALLVYRDGLATAKDLAAKDANNPDWQTALVVAYYNMAGAGEQAAANFASALDVLKRLEKAGQLPDDKRALIEKIQGKLAALKSRPRGSLGPAALSP